MKTQIEKLNNETKSNIEEFIDIAKQIQEINSRTKIDPIHERNWRLEKLEGTKYLSYIFKIENKNTNGSNNKDNLYKNILYNNNNNKNGVEKSNGC